MRQGRKVQGKNHTGPCRSRRLKEDKDPRIAAAAEPLDQEVAGRLEEKDAADASSTSGSEGATTAIGDTSAITIQDNNGDAQPEVGGRPPSDGAIWRVATNGTDRT